MGPYNKSSQDVLSRAAIKCILRILRAIVVLIYNYYTGELEISYSETSLYRPRYTAIPAYRLLSAAVPFGYYIKTVK